jgi:small ligand-binding sensory domain FIST
VLRAGVGLSTLEEPGRAAEEACAEALAGAGRCDAAILLCGPGRGDAMPALLDAAVGALGSDAVVGTTAHGVLAPDREHALEPALVVLALSGIEAHPFLIPGVAGREEAAAEEIAARLGAGGCAEDLVVLFPDPRTQDLGALLGELGDALGDARIVGAGSADPLSGVPLQFEAREVVSGGLAGIALRSTQPARIGVTQACRPATALLTVTRCRGHWVLELDGRPALEVYREVARGPLAEDLGRAAAFLLVALPIERELETLRPGSYLVRHVIGFDEKENAFAIPEIPRPGMRLALAQREPEAAREDLKAMLEGLSGGSPAFGLYLDCCARAMPFFGIPGLESAYLSRAFEGVPIAGMLGSCEIGPIGRSTQLLTYTGVMALIDG